MVRYRPPAARTPDEVAAKRLHLKRLEPTKADIDIVRTLLIKLRDQVTAGVLCTVLHVCRYVHKVRVCSLR